MKRCIFASGSADYLWPAAVTVKRMARAMTGKVDARLYLVGDGGVDPELEAFCRPHVKVVPLDMSGFRFDQHFREKLNITTFARLFALRSLVETHDRILYVDCDTLFLDGPLDALFAGGTGGAPLAAVRDGEFWSGSAKRRLRPYLRGLGIPPDRYFNAGVLLVDAEEARRIDLVEACFRVLRDRPEICNMHDQSALNHACGGNWSDLSPRWNWQFGQAMLAATWQQMAPHIVHFSGRTKPWSDPLRRIPAVLTEPFTRVPQIAALWQKESDADPGGPVARRTFLRFALSERPIRPELITWFGESAAYLDSMVWDRQAGQVGKEAEALRGRRRRVSKG